MTDLFTPAPPAETEAQRWEHIVARELAARPLPPQPGPLRQFRMSDFYDPRPNIAGRTYWGD